ncbi:MAG: TetR/AcrR family transcriptional regulator [Treponema sp.]|jgi:AcrR family transcriptional regulator|nr:TetR/AcrR family transcriptional regulator [Treponema sp.]
MTNDDIIKAAFKVWGRELYRTTSLTEIAQELGVSKPALYRHFRDKDALLDAMYSSYFDDCANFIKNGYEKAVAAPSGKEMYLILTRTIGEYYALNREAFVFSLIQVYNSRDSKDAEMEFCARGIDFKLLARGTAFYPSAMQLVMATLIFCVANFHHHENKNGGAPSNELVDSVLAQIEDRIEKGMGLDAGKVAALNYENLERQAAAMVYEDTETNALLRAVAEAVAEAGPWDASMEMVARRSGLSKSGLYAHFKNRQDMLSQLFISEFTRIVNFTRTQIETTEESEEQLYLAIISIADYLRSRPEILVAINWIKTRRLDLGKEVSGRLFRIIGSIKMEAIRNYDQHLLVWAAQWILFMIVNILALWPSKNPAEISNESFRLLFRFIALGLEGLDL